MLWCCRKLFFFCVVYFLALSIHLLSSNHSFSPLEKEVLLHSQPMCTQHGKETGSRSPYDPSEATILRQVFRKSGDLLLLAKSKEAIMPYTSIRMANLEEWQHQILVRRNKLIHTSLAEVQTLENRLTASLKSKYSLTMKVCQLPINFSRY